MRTIIMTVVAACFLIGFSVPVFPAEQAKSSAKEDLASLVKKVTAKLEDGKASEEALAEELKEFDALLAKHKEEKTDEVAQILLMKAMLYLQILDNSEKGLATIKQLKKEFPDTTPGKNADQIVESIEKHMAAEKIQKSLVEGKPFPDFNAKDLEGNPLSVARFKGKAVLVDFWATWCGPCVRELPNVLETYQKYHEHGFEIIGISLDKDEAALKKFLKKEKMTWPQFFDGKGWENELAGRYGVTSIPATYLLDGEGKIVAKNLRGPALETAVAKLLAKP